MNEDYDYFQCPPEISSEIENWRRWLMSGGGGRGSCRSLEGRYRSLEWDGKRAMVEVNVLDAVEIERAVRKLPKKNKAALKAYHIQRLPTNIMRRKLGERDIGCLMRNSWSMLKNLLDKRKMCYATRITDEPSPDEIDRLEAA